jgi:hypothetical protein
MEPQQGPATSNFKLQRVFKSPFNLFEISLWVAINHVIAVARKIRMENSLGLGVHKTFHLFDKKNRSPFFYRT